MLSAERFEPARVRDRETAAFRQALLSVRVAPVLHASFLPPPVQVEHSLVRARVCNTPVPLSFRNKRGPIPYTPTPPSSIHLHFTLSSCTEAPGLYSNISDTRFN
jgi:hypothetical protein